MEDEFQFDDINVEFADDAAEEDNAWDGEFADFADEIEPDEEKKIIDKFKDLMKDSRLCLLPLVLERSKKGMRLHQQCTSEVWGGLPEGDKHTHKPWMSEYSVSQLSRIAMRMITTCVYTSDGGYHYNRYHGNGDYRLGNWVPENESTDYVVPVSCELEACAMAVSACIEVDSKRGNGTTAEGKVQTVVTYNYEDVSGSSKHDIQFKKALVKFLTPLAPGEKWDNVKLRRKPFVWEALARELLKHTVVVPEMTSLSGFHMYVNKKFRLPKAQIPLGDMLKCDISMNVYREIIKHSWFTGGMFVRHESFMVKAHELFPSVAWSGPIPTSLPNWASTVGSKYERDGASAGNPGLALSVTALATRGAFTGVVWNPSGTGTDYVSARGVAIPIGTDFSSAKSGLEWCSNNRNCTILLVNSPTPFILCVAEGAGSHKIIEYGVQFSRASFLALWKAAPVIGYYNFLANLCNTFYAGKHPSKPYFCTGVQVDGGLHHYVIEPQDMPIARYAIREESTKITSAEALFDRYFNNGRSGDGTRPHPEGGPHDDIPEAKRPKRSH